MKLNNIRKEKILIELILTNQCNKRCEYCDLNFTNQVMTSDSIDYFIKFIKNNPAEYVINFFGGEALLEYEKIVFIVNQLKDYVTKFTIGTNGKLLNNENMVFFKNNNFLIYLSIDNITNTQGLNVSLFKKYKDIINVNFINDPYFLFNSIKTFESILEMNIKGISFLPVLATKKWSRNMLIELSQIIKHIRKNSFDSDVSFYGYYNGVAVEKQFIFDTNGVIYQDIDSLLWLQKQYKVLSTQLSKKIEKETNIGTINELTKIEDLFGKYDIKQILKLVFEIPKEQDYIQDYHVISKLYHL